MKIFGKPSGHLLAVKAVINYMYLDLMVEDCDDIITDLIKVANSMNTHYTNITNSMGMDKNSPDFSCLEVTDFVDNSMSYYTDHPVSIQSQMVQPFNLKWFN